MIIDFHTHILPNSVRTKYHERMGVKVEGEGRVRSTTIEDVIEAADNAGVDYTVISNPRCVRPEHDLDKQLEAVQKEHRTVAEHQAKHKNIYACATTNPYGGDKFLRELERAVKQDGLKAVWITSSLSGNYPDDDIALPFFQLVTQLDIPVVMHPPAVGFGEERLREYRLASSIGRPMDLTLAISRLIVRGIFEKFPTLKLVATHLGGGICEMIGRMNYAYELQDEANFLGPYEPMLIKHPPLHYLKMMYLELTCYHLPAAQCALDTVGTDRLLFGTDAPPLKPLKKRGVDLIRQLKLSPENEAKVFAGNAKKLLKV